MAKRKKPGTPITARDFEALNSYRDDLDRRDRVLKDPKFQEFWAIFQKLSPGAQRELKRKMRFLANRGTGRLKVVVGNAR